MLKAAQATEAPAAAEAPLADAVLRLEVSHIPPGVGPTLKRRSGGDNVENPRLTRLTSWFEPPKIKTPTLRHTTARVRDVDCGGATIPCPLAPRRRPLVSSRPKSQRLAAVADTESHGRITMGCRFANCRDYRAFRRAVAVSGCRTSKNPVHIIGDTEYYRCAGRAPAWKRCCVFRQCGTWSRASMSSRKKEAARARPTRRGVRAAPRPESAGQRRGSCWATNSRRGAAVDDASCAGSARPNRPRTSPR
jgi:hypothetical protein